MGPRSSLGHPIHGGRDVGIIVQGLARMWLAGSKVILQQGQRILHSEWSYFGL